LFKEKKSGFLQGKRLVYDLEGNQNRIGEFQNDDPRVVKLFTKRAFNNILHPFSLIDLAMDACGGAGKVIVAPSHSKILILRRHARP